MNPKTFLNIAMIFTVFLMISCNSMTRKNTPATQHDDNAPNKEQIVGNSKDEHGCLTSAGYCWSEALKDCIRIWEAGIKLQSLSGETVFAVFSKDVKSVEIFSKDLEEPILCHQTSDERIWISTDEEIRVEKKGDNTSVSIRKTEYTNSKK